MRNSSDKKSEILFQFPRKQQKVHDSWLPLANCIPGLSWPFCEDKKTLLEKTLAEKTEMIIRDLHPFGETFNYISHLSYLKSILGFVIPRDLWNHRYQSTLV